MTKLTINNFDFELPSNLIAQNPLQDKTAARLLHIQNNHDYQSYTVKDLPNILKKNDLLIFNNTKVIPAKLIGKKGNATITVTLHKQLNSHHWMSFIKNSRRIKINDEIIFSNNFKCSVIAKYDTGEVKLHFNYNNIFAKLHEFGLMPLPPYIKRTAKLQDDYNNYQSIFAKYEGAVAAPTASLHFTKELVQQLNEKGIQHSFVTLHVGAGTFLPVKVDDITKHKMHTEYGELTTDTINKIKETKANNGKIIAVGTTSLRVLEYVALKYGSLQPFCGEIDLFVYPSYQFKVVDSLFTNFHLPKSTLFMLVSAFSGLDNMQNAYKYAINNKYRFFSYGDCCLLEKQIN